MGRQFVGYHIGTQEPAIVRVPDILLKDKRFLFRKPEFVCISVDFLGGSEGTDVCLAWEDIAPLLKGKSLEERLSVLNEKLRSLVGVIIATGM